MCACNLAIFLSWPLHPSSACSLCHTKLHARTKRSVLIIIWKENIKISFHEILGLFMNGVMHYIYNFCLKEAEIKGHQEHGNSIIGLPFSLLPLAGEGRRDRSVN